MPKYRTTTIRRMRATNHHESSRFVAFGLLYESLEMVALPLGRGCQRERV
jgi:hypothetical protein